VTDLAPELTLALAVEQEAGCTIDLMAPISVLQPITRKVASLDAIGESTMALNGERA
jgi:hypothetical protein